VDKEKSGEGIYPHSFFKDDEEPVIDLLRPIARPNKPIYFKLFFYAQGKSELQEGRLKIKNSKDEAIKELSLEGSGNILSVLLKEGLPTGEYTAMAKIGYGDQTIETEESFTVAEEKEALIKITELSVTKEETWKPLTIHLIVRNNGNTPIQIVPLIELRNAKGQRISVLKSSLTKIPAGEEKRMELSWEMKLKPGLYKATALVAYGEKLVQKETFFIAPPYLGAGEN
jgi:hypothetical protein